MCEFVQLQKRGDFLTSSHQNRTYRTFRLSLKPNQVRLNTSSKSGPKLLQYLKNFQRANSAVVNSIKITKYNKNLDEFLGVLCLPIYLPIIKKTISSRSIYKPFGQTMSTTSSSNTSPKVAKTNILGICKLKPPFINFIQIVSKASQNPFLCRRTFVKLFPSISNSAMKFLKNVQFQMCIFP